MSEDPHPDRDSERNEDPKVMGRAAGGAAGAGAGAGLGLATLGPLGAVVGALAGGVGGWWAGRGVVDAVEEVDRADGRFQQAHEQAGVTRPYQEARHAYRLGYLAARNPQNAAADFDEIEGDLRGAWIEARLHDRDPVGWDDVRSEVRRGYDIARGEAE